MKLLYKPFGIVAGVIGGRVGQSLFKQLWARIDGGEPPNAKTEEASLGKVVAAQALEAATLAGAAAAVDRLSMRWFRYLTGIWPGDKPPEEGVGDAESPSEPVSA
jgi:hypothetical protein